MTWNNSLYLIKCFCVGLLPFALVGLYLAALIIGPIWLELWLLLLPIGILIVRLITLIGREILQAYELKRYGRFQVK
jgi:hypothetical protein